MVTFSQQQLRNSSRLQRQQQQIQQRQQAQQLQQVQQQQQQVTQVQTQKIQQARNEYGEWVQAEKLVRAGKGHAARGDPALWGKIKHLRKNLGFMQSEQIANLRSKGVEPVVSKGKLIGGVIQTSTGGVSVGISALEKGFSYTPASTQSPKQIVEGNVLDQIIKQRGAQPSTVTSIQPYRSQDFKRDLSTLGPEFLHKLRSGQNPFSAFKGRGSKLNTYEDKPSSIIKTGSISPKEDYYYTRGEVFSQFESEKKFKHQEIITKYVKEQKEYFKSDEYKEDIKELQDYLKSDEYKDKAKKLQENIKEDGYKSLTPAKANSLVKDLSLYKKLHKLEADMNINLNKLSQQRNYFEKSKTTGDVVYGASTIAPIVGVIGLSAVTSNPFPLVLYGTYKASESEKKGTIRITDKSNIPIYSDVKVPISENVESTLWIASAGFGALGQMKAIESSIVVGEVEALSNKPLTFKGLKVKGPEYDLDILKGTAVSNQLRADVSYFGKTYKAGPKSYILPAGEGEVTISGTLGWNLKAGTPTKYFSKTSFDIGSKGFGYTGSNIGELYLGSEAGLLSSRVARGQLQESLGSTTIIPRYGSSAVYTTKDIPLHANFPSPKVYSGLSRWGQYRQNVLIRKELERNFIYGGDVIKSYDTAQALKLSRNKYFVYTGAGDYGTVTIVRPSSSTGVKFIQSSGRRSSKDYLSSLYADQTEQLATTKLSPLLKSSISTSASIKALPSSSGAPTGSSAGIGSALLKESSTSTTISPTTLADVPLSSALGASRFDVLSPTGKIKLDTGSLGRFGDLGVLGSRLETGLDTRIKLDTKTKSKEDARALEKQQPRLNDLLKSKQQQKQKQKQQQQQNLKQQQQQKLRQQQKQKQQQISILRGLIRSKQNVSSRLKAPLLFLTSKQVQKLAKGIKEDPELFSAFSKRFGKPLELGTFSTQTKAEQKLKGYLQKTLGASGQIFKGSDALNFQDLKLFGSKEFRPSKISKKRIVQKRRYRLASGSETREIQSFKFKKTKRPRKSLLS